MPVGSPDKYLGFCSILKSGAHLSRLCSVFCKTFHAVLDYRHFLQKKPSNALVIDPDMETEAKKVKHCLVINLCC